MEFKLDIDLGRTLHLLLFHNVTNRGNLLQLMQTSALSPELAFLNASLDTFPVLATAHKALVSQAGGTIRTHTLHLELVYNISGSKHVEAARRLVQGTEVDLSELPKRADQALIQKFCSILCFTGCASDESKC